MNFWTGIIVGIFVGFNLAAALIFRLKIASRLVDRNDQLVAYQFEIDNLVTLIKERQDELGRFDRGPDRVSRDRRDDHHVYKPGQ